MNSVASWESAPQERRIAEVCWRFGGGPTIQQRFADQPAMQHITVDVTAMNLTMEIVATRVGNPDHDYTPISEVSLTGTT